MLSGAFDGAAWTLETAKGCVHAGWVVNCAGLYGAVIEARLLGAAHFTIRPRKGQFVVFDKPAARLVRAIIQPVPSATTKGVVVARTIYGNVLVGPTTEAHTCPWSRRVVLATGARPLGVLNTGALQAYVYL